MTHLKRRRPSSRLIAHDLCFEPKETASGHKTHLPTIECERRGTLSIDECRACERFARIETLEHGYVMLCRSGDETFDADE
jgi:hypothetical protein